MGIALCRPSRRESDYGISDLLGYTIPQVPLFQRADLSNHRALAKAEKKDSVGEMRNYLSAMGGWNEDGWDGRNVQSPLVAGSNTISGTPWRRKE